MVNNNILPLVENYNSKISSKINKVFTDRLQFRNILVENDLVSKDNVDLVLDSLGNGSYYVYQGSLYGPKVMTDLTCLAHILYRCDDSVILDFVHKYDKEYITYDDFINNNREKKESDKSVEKKLLEKFPKLFISKLWFYKTINDIPHSKGPLDIFMANMKEG